jgi:HD domain-containing protein
MAARAIEQIERFVRVSMEGVADPELRIAHGFQHVDRVRCWARQIAAGEGFEDEALVEAAALLHDVGLAHVERRSEHAWVGAEVAAAFLRSNALFADSEVEAIAAAIRCHSVVSGGGVLGEILRDADKLDTLGAVGIMRAFTSKYRKPPYGPQGVRGETWGLPIAGFEARFAAGLGIGPTIVDQIHFQISLGGDLRTATAQRLGAPLVAYMRAFVVQLAAEVEAGRTTP